MSGGLPQIAKDAQRVRGAIEGMWTRMARRHKYGTGMDLRAAAKAVVVASLRVWREQDRAGKIAIARELRAAVDLLKLELQLGQEVQAFRSWKEYEAVADLVKEIGRQSGRWLSSLQINGQNASAEKPRTQRAETLSSRPAPANGAAL